MESNTSALSLSLGTCLLASTEQPFSQSLASPLVNLTTEAEGAEWAQRAAGWDSNTAVFASVAAIAVSALGCAGG